MKRFLPIILAVILILSAIGHALMPEFYAPMIPDFIPENLANIATTILEAGIGMLLLVPKYRHWGGLGFMILMIGFLPIHTWDMFRETPAIGPPPAPLIRFLFQFVLIYAGSWVYKKYTNG